MSLPLSNPKHWHGLWTALVTPLKLHQSALQIDISSLERLIEAQLSSGTLTGLVIAGSTGEGSLLPTHLYEALLKESVRIVGGRVPLVAGLGIGGTDSALKNAEVAAKVGFQGLLASPPAYIKTPQRGLIRHFSTLAKVGLPVCVYEIPGRAVSSVQLDTLKALLDSADGANIVATKDATADIPRALQSHELFGARIALLSGDDFTFAPFLCSGGHGVISVATHIIPKRMKHIYDSVLSRKLEQAVLEQNLIRPLVDSLFWESNPIPVKCLMKDVGHIDHDIFCEPLGPMDPAKRAAMLALFKKTGDLA